MKKFNKSPLAAAMGVAFISSVSAAAANAEANPFGMTELSSGYMQLAEADKAAGEMKCGSSMGGMAKPKAPEGACAGMKKTGGAAATEGSCGAMMKDGKMKPGMEAVCGAMMKGKEGACGMMKPGETMKMPEGKCGAACGEGMKNCSDAKAKEGACGANMKGCGEAMQGCGEMTKMKDGACGAGMKKPPATTTEETPAAK